MAAGLKMSTSFGADLAPEGPFLGAFASLGFFAGLELCGVDFLGLVGFKTQAWIYTLGGIAQRNLEKANIP